MMIKVLQATILLSKRKRYAPALLKRNGVDKKLRSKIDGCTRNRVSLRLAKPILLGELEKEAICVFSPLCLQISLGTSGSVSSSSVKDVFQSFVKFSTTDDICFFAKRCIESVLADGSPLDGPFLSCAFSVWIDDPMGPIIPEFDGCIRHYFRAPAKLAIFQNKPVEAASVVNACVVKAPFMTSGDRQYIRAYDGFKVLRLPFAQGRDNERHFSMYWYLPDDSNHVGLNDLVQKPTSAPSFIESHIPHIKVRVGNLLIPKLKMPFQFEASSILRGLGFKSPFKKHYGFTDMVGRKAAPKKVQKRRIDFVADHPFLFVIREDVRWSSGIHGQRP
ncbi:OLC1v1018339C1 [Oldenlandia corymbosa var. corymbosa]|uniref:OLC1v1018339C1 n=1 Tax=Oldenlandia corymbosa var. corymbosa TaxID=529605 RepID=A0AAV1EBC2_OLDCO|nr:OLC1v1018339C1 [Oldenlandia corymbosa var. corymbosa]